MEYNFKDIYKTFNISYISNKDLLNNNFVDDSNLKVYESIEEFTNNYIKIIIRRFKLSILFEKNLNFSENLIISEDYNFNPNLLNHSDRLIKIAIVKDNYEKWINSNNLYHYDYIFSLKEYHHELNMFNNIFIIEEKSIYEQIKFVLNELYRRKLNKFYFFVTDINFQNVFPKWNNYFTILNSDLFDEQWYKKRYGLKDNTDSVVHFLLIGFSKGYNPGPDFNTSGYLDYYADVKESGKNPLVHYERFGKNEGRNTKFFDIPKNFYSVILNSSLFDEEWYRRNYNIPDDVNPIIHYYNEGCYKGYNPGPNFSTNDYLECNIDVKENGINPLVHYEIYGRDEKRKLKKF